MFLDASVIVAILNGEPGYEEIVRRIEDNADNIYTSPMARFEAVISLARSRSGVHTTPTDMDITKIESQVNAFLSEAKVSDIMISSSIGDGAIRAAATYGRAVGHPAKLNFGDCFAYACAKAYRVKLAYKGHDFAETDLA